MLIIRRTYNVMFSDWFIAVSTRSVCITSLCQREMVRQHRRSFLHLKTASPISDWRTGPHWDMGRSFNDDTIQSLSTSSKQSSPHSGSEWLGSAWPWIHTERRASDGSGQLPFVSNVRERRGAAKVNMAVSGAKGERWVMRRGLKGKLTYF